MGLFVSTTGTDVSIPELGIVITHPTTDKDMGTQFSSEEIQGSSSLTTAIVAGTLVWRKIAAGTIQTPANYDGDFLEIERMNAGGLIDDRAVTFKDLTAAAATSKAGRITAGSFTGNPKKATVTLTTSFASTNYSITVTGADSRSWTIESKAVGSFIINSNANAALAGETMWQAEPDGNI